MSIENPRQAQAPNNNDTFTDGMFGVSHNTDPEAPKSDNDNPDHIIENHYTGITLEHVSRTGLLQPQEAHDIPDHVAEHVAGAAAYNEGIIPTYQGEPSAPTGQPSLPNYLLPQPDTLNSRLTEKNKKTIAKVAVAYAVLSGVIVGGFAAVGGYGIIKAKQTESDYKDLGNVIANEAEYTDPLMTDENGTTTVQVPTTFTPPPMETQRKAPETSPAKMDLSTFLTLTQEEQITYAAPILRSGRSKSYSALFPGQDFNMPTPSDDTFTYAQNVSNIIAADIRTATQLANTGKQTGNQANAEKGKKLLAAIVDEDIHPEYFQSLLDTVDGGTWIDASNTIDASSGYTELDAMGTRSMVTYRATSGRSQKTTEFTVTNRGSGDDDKNAFFVINSAYLVE